ncbi:MAG TPA: GNAT family N-acetyltransferase [Tepidisphaeraceae bacterium]|jgi:tagatose 1,6-diphosphate aldolase
MRFSKLVHGQDTDGELQLVAPAARFVDDFLAACAHPQCWADTATHWTREQLLSFVQHHPNGTFGHGPRDRWPGYYFWMRLLPADRPAVPIAGTLSLRIGQDEELLRYWGHIGYGVFPPVRGRHYAERACRLVLPLARWHKLDALWITCNPDNFASRRTCERLGGELVETVDIPPDHPLRLKGETQKCRYRVAL